jgi:multiple sugar transport system permease protein
MGTLTARFFPAKRRNNRIPLKGRNTLILLAVVPGVMFYLLWVVIPLLYSGYISLFDWAPLRATQPFVGLGNYVEALTKDPLFRKALGNTVFYMVVMVPVNAVVALGVAVLINSLPRFRGLFRVIYFLPVITSTVAVSILWKWLYQGRFGLFNQLLELVLVNWLHLPIDPRVPWLTSPALAMPSVMLMSIWQGMGFTMVIFLAGLSGIPQVFYEAARIDGAGRWQQFRHITVPLLQQTTVFVIITGVIGAMQVFTPMYIMTDGGPVNSTKTYVFHLFDKAFGIYRFGYASAMAFILFAIILVLTLIQLRLTRVKWSY